MADNRFSGKSAALARMARIPVAVRVVAREALDRESAFLVEQIRPHVPVEEGELADSLEWHRTPRVDRMVNVITEGANDDTLGRKARANEFGRGGDNPMEARPHFFPVYRANKRKIQNRIQKAVRQAVRKIWGNNQ